MVSYSTKMNIVQIISDEIANNYDLPVNGSVALKYFR